MSDKERRNSIRERLVRRPRHVKAGVAFSLSVIGSTAVAILVAKAMIGNSFQRVVEAKHTLGEYYAHDEYYERDEYYPNDVPVAHPTEEIPYRDYDGGYDSGGIGVVIDTEEAEPEEYDYVPDLNNVIDDIYQEQQQPQPQPSPETTPPTLPERDPDPIPAPTPIQELPPIEVIVREEGDVVESVESPVVEQPAVVTETKEEGVTGSWGGCEWDINDAGTLTVRAGTGGGYAEVANDDYMEIDRMTFTDRESPWHGYSSEIKQVVCEDGVKLSAASAATFSGLTSLESCDLSHVDVSGVTDLSEMFRGCLALKTVNLSGWDVSQAKNMSSMFRDCTNLTSLDISGWKVDGVANMTGMFEGCVSLKDLKLPKNIVTGKTDQVIGMFAGCRSLVSLDLSDWDVSGIKSLGCLFSGCEKLTSISVKSWKTSNIRDMSKTFADCSSLERLDLSGWDISQVKTLSWTFAGCSKLVDLNISGWKTGSLERAFDVFKDCSSMREIDLSGWDTHRIGGSTNMFRGCTSISRITVGPDYVMKSERMFPKATNEKDAWWSVAEGSWYTRRHIVSVRSGTSDTYASVEG